MAHITVHPTSLTGVGGRGGKKRVHAWEFVWRVCKLLHSKQGFFPFRKYFIFKEHYSSTEISHYLNAYKWKESLIVHACISDIMSTHITTNSHYMMVTMKGGGVEGMLDYF